jgi:predicted DNA-binding transcriptional regulator AlpA
MMEDENLWTPRELSKFLGYSESTICRMVSQCPEKLPPRVRTLARPRWLPEVAREWARESSFAPLGRVGRPRNVR